MSRVPLFTESGSPVARIDPEQATHLLDDGLVYRRYDTVVVNDADVDTVRAMLGMAAPPPACSSPPPTSRRDRALEALRARLSHPFASEHLLVAVTRVLQREGGFIKRGKGTFAWWAEELAAEEADRLRALVLNSPDGEQQRVRRLQRLRERDRAAARRWARETLQRASEGRLRLVDGCVTAGWRLTDVGAQVVAGGDEG